VASAAALFTIFQPTLLIRSSTTKMISDDELYRLAIFLGSAAMLLIILYHFLEVNAVEEPAEAKTKTTISTQSETKASSAGR